MEREQLEEFIKSHVPEAEVEEGGIWTTALIPSGKWRIIAKELRDSEETQFDFLFCLTGVDWPEYMTVVYHLNSSIKGHNLIVKARINDRENPEIETVSDIWRTAEFHEREVYDLFGIVFRNHPDLRRIFLTDDWVGYPLRKDYKDEVNIVEL